MGQSEREELLVEFVKRELLVPSSDPDGNGCKWGLRGFWSCPLTRVPFLNFGTGFLSHGCKWTQVACDVSGHPGRMQWENTNKTAQLAAGTA